MLFPKIADEFGESEVRDVRQVSGRMSGVHAGTSVTLDERDGVTEAVVIPVIPSPTTTASNFAERMTLGKDGSLFVNQRGVVMVETQLP